MPPVDEAGAGRGRLGAAAPASLDVQTPAVGRDRRDDAVVELADSPREGEEQAGRRLHLHTAAGALVDLYPLPEQALVPRQDAVPQQVANRSVSVQVDPDRHAPVVARLAVEADAGRGCARAREGRPQERERADPRSRSDRNGRPARLCHVGSSPGAERAYARATHRRVTRIRDAGRSADWAPRTRPPGRRPAGVDSGGALLASGRTAPPLRLRRAARGRDGRRAPPRPGGDRTRRRAGAAARREPRVGAGDRSRIAGGSAGRKPGALRGTGSRSRVRPPRATNGPSTCRTST